NVGAFSRLGISLRRGTVLQPARLRAGSGRPPHAAPAQDYCSTHGRHHRSREPVATGKARPFLHAGFVQGPTTARRRESEISNLEFEIECDRWFMVGPAPALGRRTRFSFRAFLVTEFRRRHGQSSTGAVSAFDARLGRRKRRAREQTL